MKAYQPNLLGHKMRTLGHSHTCEFSKIYVYYMFWSSTDLQPCQSFHHSEISRGRVPYTYSSRNYYTYITLIVLYYLNLNCSCEQDTKNFSWVQCTLYKYIFVDICTYKQVQSHLSTYLLLLHSYYFLTHS